MAQSFTSAEAATRAVRDRARSVAQQCQVAEHLLRNRPAFLFPNREAFLLQWAVDRVRVAQTSDDYLHLWTIIGEVLSDTQNNAFVAVLRGAGSFMPWLCNTLQAGLSDELALRVIPVDAYYRTHHLARPSLAMTCRAAKLVLQSVGNEDVSASRAQLCDVISRWLVLTARPLANQRKATATIVSALVPEAYRAIAQGPEICSTLVRHCVHKLIMTWELQNSMLATQDSTSASMEHIKHVVSPLDKIQESDARGFALFSCLLMEPLTAHYRLQSKMHLSAQKASALTMSLCTVAIECICRMDWDGAATHDALNIIIKYLVQNSAMRGGVSDEMRHTLKEITKGTLQYVTERLSQCTLNDTVFDDCWELLAHLSQLEADFILENSDGFWTILAEATSGQARPPLREFVSCFIKAYTSTRDSEKFLLTWMQRVCTAHSDAVYNSVLFAELAFELISRSLTRNILFTVPAAYCKVLPSPPPASANLNIAYDTSLWPARPQAILPFQVLFRLLARNQDIEGVDDMLGLLIDAVLASMESDPHQDAWNPTLLQLLNSLCRTNPSSCQQRLEESRVCKVLARWMPVDKPAQLIIQFVSCCSAIRGLLDLSHEHYDEVDGLMSQAIRQVFTQHSYSSLGLWDLDALLRADGEAIARTCGPDDFSALMAAFIGKLLHETCHQNTLFYNTTVYESSLLMNGVQEACEAIMNLKQDKRVSVVLEILEIAPPEALSNIVREKLIEMMLRAENDHPYTLKAMTNLAALPFHCQNVHMRNLAAYVQSCLRVSRSNTFAFTLIFFRNASDKAVTELLTELAESGDGYFDDSASIAIIIASAARLKKTGVSKQLYTYSARFAEHLLLHCFDVEEPSDIDARVLVILEALHACVAMDVTLSQEAISGFAERSGEHLVTLRSVPDGGEPKSLYASHIVLALYEIAKLCNSEIAHAIFYSNCAVFAQWPHEFTHTELSDVRGAARETGLWLLKQQQSRMIAGLTYFIAIDCRNERQKARMLHILGALFSVTDRASDAQEIGSQLRESVIIAGSALVSMRAEQALHAYLDCLHDFVSGNPWALRLSTFEKTLVQCQRVLSRHYENWVDAETVVRAVIRITVSIQRHHKARIMRRMPLYIGTLCSLLRALSGLCVAATRNPSNRADDNDLLAECTTLFVRLLTTLVDPPTSLKAGVADHHHLYTQEARFANVLRNYIPWIMAEALRLMAEGFVPAHLTASLKPALHAMLSCMDVSERHMLNGCIDTNMRVVLRNITQEWKVERESIDR